PELDVHVTYFKAEDDVVPLRVVSGEGAEGRRARRLPSEAEIPLRDLHLLDDVMVQQGGEDGLIRAGELCVGRTITGLTADIEALPIDPRGAQPFGEAASTTLQVPRVTP